jgi:ribonuclease HI
MPAGTQLGLIKGK